MNRNETDWLKQIFERLPDGDAPSPAFAVNVMKRIIRDEEKRKRRNERLALLAVIVASVLIIVLSVFALRKVDICEIKLPQVDMASVSFYIYIGALSLLLLTIDHFFCNAYRKRHN
ncbi:MAG: hypothetical protein LBH04_09000 [Tannerellaceae bacterium]|jgi:pilus assembly protein TadC|nr:hypothetical protein [Tannerellaceae bacterium]